MDHSPTSSDSFSQTQTTFAQRVLIVLALTLAALLVLVGAGLAFSVLLRVLAALLLALPLRAGGDWLHRRTGRAGAATHDAAGSG